MRIGLVEFLLILAIASLTIGPQVALFVDRWMRRANRANARAARCRAEYAAQMAVERDALIAGVLDGYAVKVASISTPEYEGYDPNVQGYTYDVEKAKQLKEQAN